MTVYWVPSADGSEYVEVDADELSAVDFYCAECHAAKTERRLQRFACPAGGGVVGILPYRKGFPSGSPYKVREGVPFWHLRCKCRRELSVNGVEVATALAAADVGEIPARRAYV